MYATKTALRKSVIGLDKTPVYSVKEKAISLDQKTGYVAQEKRKVAPMTNAVLSGKPPRMKFNRELEAAYAAGVEDERERWERTEVKQYLIAAADGSMSRNNRESLASEILKMLMTYDH